MVGSDPIADFITRLANAAVVGKASASAPYSRIKHEVARILEREGFVSAVAKRGRKTRKALEVALSYTDDGISLLHGVRRVSKPSRRVYVGTSDLRSSSRRGRTLILSTPKGVMTARDARAKKVGGEALVEVW